MWGTPAFCRYSGRGDDDVNIMDMFGTWFRTRVSISRNNARSGPRFPTYRLSQSSEGRKQSLACSPLTVNPLQHQHHVLPIVLQKFLQARGQAVEAVHSVVLVESVQLLRGLDAGDEDSRQQVS